MAMGREGDRQGDLIVTWSELPRSPGHVFYDRLQEVLIAGGFDGFVEATCEPYYAVKIGAPSLPPGRSFRMHMVGYFEGIASERGIAWRCSDSMSLRDFLRLENREEAPDHSWLSKTRRRLPHEVHESVFGWVLQLVAEQGLVKGKRIGVDAEPLALDQTLLGHELQYPAKHRLVDLMGKPPARLGQPRVIGNLLPALQPQKIAQ